MKRINRDTTIYILTIIFSVIFLFAGYSTNKINFTEQADIKSYKAKIISIEEKTEEKLDYSYESLSSHVIRFKAEIENNELGEDIAEGYQYIDEIVAVNPKEVEAGDKIIVSMLDSRKGDSMVWTFIEYDRSNVLMFLLVSFFVLVVVFGRKKGVNTIISLMLTCLSVFMVFVPAILNGKNIYLSSITVSVFIVFMNLLLISGANQKTLCAIVGNLGGLFVAGLLAYVISNILNLTGLIDDDSMFLLMLDKPLELKAILWSSIVIGSLGAVMDVSMSIASAMNELAENMCERSFKSMLKSGINIGQDTIGTMTNTLVLAYVGSSLSMVLLLVINYKDPILLFNLEMIVFEIIQAIIGSLGILFTIPITSVFAAYIYNRKKISINSQIDV